MRIITLDLTHCRSTRDVHRLLKACFDFPDYYGENWDALWDCLHGWFIGEGDVHVEIRGYWSLNDDLRRELAVMFDIFAEVSADDNVEFVVVS